MSSDLTLRVIPAYDEAEKGDLDTRTHPVEIALPSQKKDISYPDEKDVAVTQVFPVPPSAKKETSAAPAKPPGKPAKRKVSKWILWQLWYNTYR